MEFYLNKSENTLHSTNPTPECNLRVCKLARNLKVVNLDSIFNMLSYNICDHCLPVAAKYQNNIKKRIALIRKFG